MSSNRFMEWRYFSEIVGRHIEDYTIPQYGDCPHDEVEQWSTEMCVAAIQKYTKRFATSKRGPDETLRDMLKIAHFACIAFVKLHMNMGRTVDIRFLDNAIPPKLPGDYGYDGTK